MGQPAETTWPLCSAHSWQASNQLEPLTNGVLVGRLQLGGRKGGVEQGRVRARSVQGRQLPGGREAAAGSGGGRCSRPHGPARTVQALLVGLRSIFCTCAAVSMHFCCWPRAGLASSTSRPSAASSAWEARMLACSLARCSLLWAFVLASFAEVGSTAKQRERERKQAGPPHLCADAARLGVGATKRSFQPPASAPPYSSCAQTDSTARWNERARQETHEQGEKGPAGHASGRVPARLLSFLHAFRSGCLASCSNRVHGPLQSKTLVSRISARTAAQVGAPCSPA